MTIPSESGDDDGKSRGPEEQGQRGRTLGGPAAARICCPNAPASRAELWAGGSHEGRCAQEARALQSSSSDSMQGDWTRHEDAIALGESDPHLGIRQTHGGGKRKSC